MVVPGVPGQSSARHEHLPADVDEGGLDARDLAVEHLAFRVHEVRGRSRIRHVRDAPAKAVVAVAIRV